MIRKLAAAPIHFYRHYLSPLKPPCCRFVPTCSQYALEALERRGLIVGILLTCWRVLRCHPFSTPGEDPVPLPRARNVSSDSPRQ